MPSVPSYVDFLPPLLVLSTNGTRAHPGQNPGFNYLGYILNIFTICRYLRVYIRLIWRLCMALRVSKLGCLTVKLDVLSWPCRWAVDQGKL